MVSKLIAVEPKQPYLAVTWQVNNYCNFRCSYCNEGNWSGTQRNDDNLEIYLKNLELIVEKYKSVGYKSFKFFFSGGEPTAWRNFIPICEWLRERLPDCTLAVNTNLSRPLGWWEKHYKLFDDVVASFHIEFADQEKYFQNTLFLCDKINYLSSKMLMHDERFWEVVEYGNYLKENLPNYFIEWTPLFDEISTNAGPWHYKDPAKVKFINEHNIETKFTKPKPYKYNGAVSIGIWDDGTKSPLISNDIIVKGQNFFEGWNCKIGDSIFINPRGYVSMASCGQGERIGHILDDISGVGPKEIICGKHHCTCGTDIIIPKFKNAEIISN